MSKIDELRAKRNNLQSRTDETFAEADKIQQESLRVADVAHNAEGILQNLEEEFEKKTALNKKDVCFLFLAISLQCLRIYGLNHLFKIDTAGKGNKIEDSLHKTQEKIFKNFKSESNQSSRLFYAPLEQIITTNGVPFDATSYAEENLELFKGANHRFSTLAHDPILGLVFGTANILTNTITCINNNIISTNHVIYDAGYINPKIIRDHNTGNTLLMIKHSIDRYPDDVQSIGAAFIKQIIHIGTDLYTPMGIELPFLNLIFNSTDTKSTMGKLLAKANVEKLTKIISTGDVLKAGISFKVACFIDYLIGLLHSFTFDEKSGSTMDLHSVKTRKILMYSNLIATSSNVIQVGISLAMGKANSLHNFDLGGFIHTLYRIATDTQFIAQIKQEFIFNNFDKMIQGDM